jgi:hypothetical protein
MREFNEENLMRKVNPYTVMPLDLKPGDVMVVTITCHIMHGLRSGEDTSFRLYRCPENAEEHEGIPQGSRIMSNEREVAAVLFPVVTWLDIEPDI